MTNDLFLCVLAALAAGILTWGFRTLPRGLRVRRRDGARTRRIAQQLRIAPIELREKTAYEACGLGRCGQPILNPLALSQPLDQSRLAEDFQMS